MLGRLRLDIGRCLRVLWIRIIHSGARLSAGEPSGIDGFERFMSEFEARGRIQQHPTNGLHGTERELLPKKRK